MNYGRVLKGRNGLDSETGEYFQDGRVEFEI